MSPIGTVMLFGSNFKRPSFPTFTMCTPFTADAVAEAAALTTGVRVEEVVDGESPYPPYCAKATAGRRAMSVVNCMLTVD